MATSSHLFLRGGTNLFASEIRSANLMRQNLKELNRSMQSIQKMIEKSRYIINRSRQSRLNGSLERSKDNKKSILTSSTKNEENAMQYSSGFKLKTNFKSKNIVNPHGQALNNKHPYFQHKNTAKMAPYKQIHDEGRTIYKFSPQKTNSFQFKTIKPPQIRQQKPQKRLLSFSKDHHREQSQLFQAKTINKKQNILIEDQQTTPNLSPSNEYQQDIPRFKTQYSQQDEKDIYRRYKLQQPTTYFEPKPQKKRLNLKLFETQTKKSPNISEGSKKSTIDSYKVSARKNLVKELEQLQTQSSTEQQRKAKFILKIKKYGFVEKKLSQQQIWNLYHELVRLKVPELKWPIVIVDQVYRRTKIGK